MNNVYLIYGGYSPNNASTNRALAYLRAFSADNFSVSIIFLMPDARQSHMEEQFPGISIEYCWDEHFINHHIIKNISYIRYLMDIYRRVQPGDIVYLYGEVDLLLLLTKKKGVRVFHERTEHPFVHSPKGRIFRLSQKKYISLCKKLEGLFVISTCLRDYFISQGVSKKKIIIVNSIVDTTRFEGLTKQSCEPYFAYCGNGNNRKDKVDELIKVFARVAARHDDIKFYIIGPTKQVYKDEQDNVKLVHDLGLDDRVVFTGMKPAREVPQLLVNAVALFLTRPNTLQNRAGFSTKLGEYLASGNPVVAAGVGDIPLFLKDRENAFVYKPEDYEAVEEAMEYILAHPLESQKIGLEGKMVAEKYFNYLNETRKLIRSFTKSPF